VAARAIIKRAKLRQLYRVAVAAPATLLETLNSALDTAVSRIEGGRTMTGEAGNGFSATFELLKDFSPDEAVEVVEDLLTVYTAAVTDLADDGTATPSDLQIHDRMLLLLAPVREERSDRSQMCLR
jgi:hypothetical protein